MPGCRVNSGGVTQLGEVLSGGSYLSQHDLRVHFGLGEHQIVEKATVLWPNGKTEILTNLAADRYYLVREGAGVVDSRLPASRPTVPR